jgi:hypothetical protein
VEKQFHGEATVEVSLITRKLSVSTAPGRDSLLISNNRLRTVLALRAFLSAPSAKLPINKFKYPSSFSFADQALKRNGLQKLEL